MRKGLKLNLYFFFSFFPIFYRYIYEIERKNYEQRTKEMLTLIENNQNNRLIELSELREQINLFQTRFPTIPKNKKTGRSRLYHYCVEISNFA